MAARTKRTYNIPSRAPPYPVACSSQLIDIGSMVERITAAELFWRHAAHIAQNVARVCQSCGAGKFNAAGQDEVIQQSPSVRLPKENVGRSDISMVRYNRKMKRMLWKGCCDSCSTKSSRFQPECQSRFGLRRRVANKDCRTNKCRLVVDAASIRTDAGSVGHDSYFCAGTKSARRPNFCCQSISC